MNETERVRITTTRISRRTLLGGATGLIAGLVFVGLRKESAAADRKQASMQAPGVTQRHPAACACPMCKRTAPSETLMA
jgi:hypothetical protein